MLAPRATTKRDIHVLNQFTVLEVVFPAMIIHLGSHLLYSLICLSLIVAGD